MNVKLIMNIKKNEKLLSEMNNEVDLTILKKSEIKVLLKRIKYDMKTYYEMLELVLTEDETECYIDMAKDCKRDIKIITEYLEKNKWTHLKK